MEAKDLQEEENKRAYLRFVDEVLVPWNLDRLDEFHTSDFVKHDGMTEIATGGVSSSQRWLRIFHEAFPDLRYDVDDLMADGDKVIARVTMRGTHTGASFMGLKPSGRAFEIKTIDIVRMRDGRAAEHWGARDTLDLLRQLGWQEGV
jgi:predicted ester cyclase